MKTVFEVGCFLLTKSRTSEKPPTNNTKVLLKTPPRNLPSYSLKRIKKRSGGLSIVFGKGE